MLGGQEKLILCHIFTSLFTTLSTFCGYFCDQLCFLRQRFLCFCLLLD